MQQNRNNRGLSLAQSPVFTGMMDASLNSKELQERKVEADFSEESLTLFIQYLYFKEILPETISCELGFALFRLGHFYQVKSLQDTMNTFLQSKPVEWFVPEATLRFYLFARNLEECKDLKEFILRLMADK